MKRRENVLAYLDWLSIWLYLLLLLVGLATIYAVNFDDGQYFFDGRLPHMRQLVWVAVSILAAAVVMILDYKFFSAMAWPFYGFMIILLLVTFAIAPSINGARSWLVFGPVSLQPAEFAKIATSLALARYLTSVDVNLSRLKSQLIAMALIALPMALVIMQRDIGTALVFTGFFLVLYREGFPATVPVIGFYVGLLFISTLLFGPVSVSLAITAVLAFLTIFIIRNWKRLKIRFLEIILIYLLSFTFVNFGVNLLFYKALQPHQQSRINVLLGREVERGANYNVEQSKIAIGSGGVLGKGYLKGTLTKGDFVPEQGTDFIFSGIGEEFGFVGSSLFLLLFMAFLLRILRLAERQRSRFTRIYAYGVASVLFLHYLVNVGMAIGLLPVIGIPLPFISYGGSSLLGFTVSLAILLKLDAYRKLVLR